MIFTQQVCDVCQIGTDRLRVQRVPPRRVMVVERVEPIYNCGHWIPDQIALAGGVDMLSNPGGHSMVTDFERVRQYDSKVLVIAPCGFDVDRAAAEVEPLARREGFAGLSAWQSGQVYLADADLVTRPSTPLVDGIELLAALFHPALFAVPERLRESVRAVTPEMVRQVRT